MTVVVAGGGPVGLGTALLLARWGVSSVVLDEHPGHEVVGSRSICTQRDVIDVFDRIGCAEPMLAEGVTWRVGRTFYREHEVLTVEFPDPGGGVLPPSPPALRALPPWINISQASVERYLLDRVAAEELVDLRWGHRVTGLAQHDSGVTVHTDRGSVTGDYLVGADGARSTVRRLLGVEFPGESYDDQFLICDIRCDLPFPNERRFHFDPEWNPDRRGAGPKGRGAGETQVLVHQCPDGVWRIDWQVPPGFDLAAEQASGALDARIRKITGDRPYQVVWRTVYRFHQRCAERFRVGRAFLAGDAAHLFAPFGARGLNSGMQDAENLAWKLAFAVRGWAGPGLLDSYHTERYAAAQENLRVTTETMRFLAPHTDAQRRHRRDVLRRAVTDPEARRQINSGKLAEPYHYLDSPLTTPADAGGPGATASGAPGAAGRDGADGPGAAGHGGVGTGVPGVAGRGGVGTGVPGVAGRGGVGTGVSGAAGRGAGVGATAPGGAGGRPAPGELCPDAPLPGPGRLRRLFGYGFAVLSAAPVEPPRVGGAGRAPDTGRGRPVEASGDAAVLWSADTGRGCSVEASGDAAVPWSPDTGRGPVESPQGGGVPVTVHRIGDQVRELLGATDTSVHLVRPDGHLAAVLPTPDPAPLAAALTRALGHPPG